MARNATATTRAPRGTKVLTQAFFSAAGGIPEAQRAGVIKAALAAIRDQLKDVREKAKIAKVKARGATGPANRKAAGRPKAAAEAPGTAATAAQAPRPRGRKPASTPPEKPMDEVGGF
jgi:hypothetical protein